MVVLNSLLCGSTAGEAEVLGGLADGLGGVVCGGSSCVLLVHIREVLLELLVFNGTTRARAIDGAIVFTAWAAFSVLAPRRD
jgi:hypothetical protein